VAFFRSKQAKTEKNRPVSGNIYAIGCQTEQKPRWLPETFKICQLSFLLF